MGPTKRKRNRGILEAAALAVVSGLILSLGWGFAQAGRAERAYTPDNLIRRPADPIAVEADAIIRLHVKANSGSPGDQDVKIKVRDILMESFGGALAAVGDAGEAEAYLEKAIPEIERTAVACLRQNGCSYGARAAVEVAYFPDKTYSLADGKEIHLPEGSYKSLTVVLGKGEGENWWCLMYPPLCYFDLVQRAVAVRKGQGPGSSAPGSGSGCAPAGEGGGTPPGNGLQRGVMLDEEAAKEVPVEVRSLLLDALKAGIAKLSGFLARSVSTGPDRAQDLRDVQDLR